MSFMVQLLFLGSRHPNYEIVKPVFDSQKGVSFEESSIHEGLRAMTFSKTQIVVQLFQG